MIQTPEEWRNSQKNKKESGSSSSPKLSIQTPDEWLAKRPAKIIKPTFTQRMTGEPVRQKDGSYRATTGVTDFLSGLPLVGVYARLGKTLGETTAYNKLDDKTREYLARTNTTSDIVPDINRSNLSIIADAVEGGVDAATAGLSSLFKKGIYQTGKITSKELIKQAEKKLLPKQIMTRFGIDTGINTAAGYSFDVAQNANEGKKGKEVLKPGIGTLSAAFLSSVLGGRNAAQLQKENSAARIAEKYGVKYNIPEAGVPNIKLESPEMRANRVQQEIKNRANLPVNKLPIGETIPLQEKGIIDAQRRLNEVPIKPEVETPKTPIVNRALKFNSRQDFINNEVGFYTRTKQKLPKNIVEDATKAWNEAHGVGVKQPPIRKVEQSIPQQVKQDVPKQPQYDAQGFRPVEQGEVLPNGYTTKMNTQTGEQMTNAPYKTKTTQEIPQQEIPKVEQPNIEIPKQKIDNDASWLSKVENKATENDIKGYKQSSERYNQRLKEDKQGLIDYAMGLGDEDPKLPRTSAHKLLSKYADDTLDSELSEKLSFSTEGLGRESAQNLVGRKILEDETTADLLATTRRKRAAKLGVSENQLRAEEAKLFKEINEEMSKNVKYTTDDLLDIISDFLC